MMYGKLSLLAAVFFAVSVTAQGISAGPPDHVTLPDQAAASQNQPEDPVMVQEQIEDGQTWRERLRQPGSRSGIIKTKQHVYYCEPGEELALSVVLPHSLEGYWGGDADAWLVLQVPDDASADGAAMGGLLLDFPVPGATEERQVIQDVPLDEYMCEALQGEYQIALILTRPEGDPLNLLDWYQGFQGLVAVSKITFAVSDDDEDADGDGNIDDDDDGNGFGDDL